MNNKDIFVSIVCVTYNHEKYITQAIEGVIMQKTSFIYELVIGEDCSTDNTRKICEEYANSYPNKIRLLPSEKNWGMQPNFIRTFNNCSGKYIALCEGDDYWIDPLKLQKQVDYLETNPSVSFCFHNAITIFENNHTYIMKPNIEKEKYTFNDIVNSYFIPTASILFRHSILPSLPEWFINIYNGDQALEILLSHEGDVGYINENMSIYRKHATGLSNTIAKDSKFILDKNIELFKLLDKHYVGKYEQIFYKKIQERKKEILRLKIKKQHRIIYYIIYFKSVSYRIFKKILNAF